jgi:fibronectin-binding autotransporter adhesin
MILETDFKLLQTNFMKPDKTFSNIILFLLVGALSLKAASGTWTGVTDSIWGDANWSASPVPGTGDTATFSGAGDGNTTINLGSGVTIGNMLFNTGGAAAYTIGNGAVGNQTLTLNNSGAITVNSTVSSNELFNAAVVLGTDTTAQTYKFVNNSTNTLGFAGNLYGGLTGGTKGTKTLAVGGSGNTVISGNMTNGGATTIALTKTGTGNLTFNGTVNATSGLNTQGAYGTVTLNRGNLALNFSNFSSSGNADLLDNYTPVSMGGGTLQVIGNAIYASTQNFINGSGVAVNPGFNVISVSNNSPTLNLGAFTQILGSQTEFIGPAYDSNPTGGSAALVPATGTIQTTTLGLQNKLLWPAARSAIATVGQYNWASVATSGSGEQSILAGDQVGSFYTTIASGTTGNADNNLDVTGSITLNNGGYNDTLRYNTPTTLTCTVANTANYTIGGILVTPNVAVNNVTFNLNTHWLKGNNVSSGSGPDAIVVYQNNTGGELIFTNGSVVNYSTILTAYVQGGPGTVVLSANSGAAGASAYSAGNYLNGGVTEITSDGSLGNLTTGTTVNLNGGTLLGGATLTLDNSGTNARPITLLGNGGGLAATAGNTMTIDGQIGSAANTGPLVIGIPASAANGNVAGLVPGTGGGTANPAVYGTGTVKLNNATGNYYYGGVTILGGATLNINSEWQLGGANQGPVTFNNGTLQYSNTLYNTAVDISGQPVTLSAGGGTIDVNTHAITYANSIGNGGSGALTVVDSTGGGSLNLLGGGTYTGATTVGDGTHSITLNFNGTLASSNVTVNSNGTLGGTGAIAGSVTWQSGSQANFNEASPLTISGSVALNGNTFTVNVPGGLPLGTGNYTLMTAAGGITGLFNTNPPVFLGAGVVNGAVSAVLTTSNNVVLVVNAPGIQAIWTNNVGGNWSGGTNWSSNPYVPHSAGDSATFGVGQTLQTVAMDANETVGSLAMTNANSFVIANAGNTLTFDNAGSGAAILIGAGTTNLIQTSMALNDNLQVSVGGGDTLTISGIVSNGPSVIKTLTVNGTGTTVLSGANSYGPSAGSVGTTLSGGGTLQVAGSGALGAGDVNVIASSTLQSGASGLNINNNVIAGSGATVTVNNNGYNFALGGTISGSGALAEAGSGTIALNGNNNYTGTTTINAGVLSISSPNNVANTAAIILNGGDLLGSGTFALNNSIGIGATGGGTGSAGLIDAASGQTLSVNGVIGSAGNAGVNSLIINSVGNAGIVLLGATNTLNGSTTISNGVLELATPMALQNSTLNYNAGSVLFAGNLTTATLGGLSGTNTSLGLTNLNGASMALTLGNNNGTAVYAGNLSGSGSLVMTGTGTQTIGSGPSGGASYAGTTVVNNGTLILGGVGNMSASGNLDISGIGGPANLIIADSEAVTVGGMIQVLYDGGAGYPAVSSLTVQNNASLSGASLSFGDGSRLANNTSVTITNNGTLSVAGAFDLNDNIGSTAQTTMVNLNGGTLAVGDFIDSDGSATHQAHINFNGGMLQANSNDPTSGPTTAFLPAFTGLTAYVNSGGAVINPEGYNITIAAAIVHGSGSPDGGLRLNGLGTLVLNGANTYTGNTIITNGTLVLGSSGSIAASQHIIVGGSGIFNGPATGAYTLGSSQALTNSSSPAVLGGNINTGSGTVAFNYASGTPSFTITNGTLSLSATTVIQINNTGPAFALGTYKLISTNGNGSGFITGTLPTTIIMGGNGLVTNATPSLLITNGELYLAVSTGSYTNPVIYPPAIAFPGALGFGASTNITGGRFGTVYHVTSLADDGSAGTFRAAVSQPNRIIIFDVGGYINLGSAVAAASNLTIAGQTAPGGGIGLMGNELSFYNQNNIICRHLRVRQGGSSSGSSGINIGSSSGQANNMIFDHTSVEFGQWDSIDAVGTYNFTVQNCIIADPINQQFGAHVQGANASYIGNLWVNAHNRQPLAKASTVYVNNVCYDFQAGYTTADTAGHFSHDIVNNYFITGPSSSAPSDDFFQFDGNQTVYAVGNMLDSSRDGVLNGSPSEPSSDIVSATPWSPVTATIPTVSAQNAYRVDVSSAGAFPSDPLDSLVIGQVMSLGISGNLITSPGNTGLANGGYGTIDGGTPLTCTDGDGIPDIWKNAVGLNLYTNQAMTIAPNGYANIENYINWLAAPHAFVQTNASVIDLWPYTLGFTNGGTYTVSGGVNGSVTLTNSHFAYFLPNPGFTGLASFNFTVADSDGTSMTNTMGLLVSVVYIPKNLVWRGDGINNIWDTTNTADWFNGNNLVMFNSSDNVTFDDTGSASPAINITGTVAPGSIVFNNSSNNYTIGGTGAISGIASLTMSGTGNLTVNNVNNFSGAVNINNSSIQLNDGSSLGNGAGAITFQSGTLVNNYASGDYLNLPNPLVVPTNATGTINLGSRIYLTGNLTGDGTLNLNVQSGGTTEQFKGNASAFAGTLNFLGSGGMRLVANGGAFGGFNNALTTVNAPVTFGFYDNSGGNTYNFGALAGNNSAAAFYDAYAGAPTLQIGALNVDTTFAGQFQTSVNLVKIGSGTLTLTGNSTHTGSTTVSSGSLTITGTFSSSPVTVANGGALRGTGFLGGGVTVQSGGSILPGILNGQAGTLTVSNNLTLTAPNLFFDLSSSPTGVNDEIVMQGGSLAMSGVNNFIFYPINGVYGAGTYTLIGGASGSSGGGTFASNLPTNTRQNFTFQNPSSGVQLVVTGNAGSLVWQGTNGSNWDLSTTVNWLNGSTADEFYNLDTVQFDDTSTNGNVSIVGAVLPASVLVTNNLVNYTIGGGVLGGGTGLVKSGSGMLTLNSSNSFSGGTLVNGGTLQLLNNYYAGGTGPITLNGGTLYLNGVGTSTTVSCVGTNALVTYGQPYAGFNLQGLGQLNLSIGGGGVFTPGGDWSGFGGTINFTTANGIREGAGIFGSSNAVWNLGIGGIYNKYGGATIYLGALFGGAGAGLSGATTATASLTTYVVGGVNTNSIFNGTISDGGAAATALVFNGPGSLTLTGNNSFSGNTTVNSGALYINNTAGSGTGSGPVSINPGSTLGGNGTIGGQVSLAAGATLAPGGSGPGTLTITNDLGLNNASVLQFQLGTNSDQVSVTGDLTIGGTLNISDAGGFGPGTYTLFSYGGALSVGTLTIGTTPTTNFTYTIDTSVQGQVNLIVQSSAPPVISGIKLSGGNLVLNGSGGPANGNYYVLTSTNLTVPLTNWTRLFTNQFDAGGNFIFTNPMSTNVLQSFYLLQLQ